MSHDNKTAHSEAFAGDFEAVSQQMAALREDMTGLVDTVKRLAGRRGSNVAWEIADGFNEAKHFAEQKGKSAEHQLEASVAAHPLLAIGLAAGAGLVVGAMTRR